MKIYVSESVLLETGFSLSRLKQAVEKGTFAILTAWRSIYDEDENRKRNKQLERDLRRLGLGFAKAKGYWSEVKPEYKKQFKGVDWRDIPSWAKETSQEDVFIVIMPQNWGNPEDFIEEMHKLGNKYEQEAIVVGVPPEYDDLAGTYLIFDNGRYQKFKRYSLNNAAKVYQSYTELPKKGGAPRLISFHD